jgi:hypothetical protein
MGPEHLEQGGAHVSRPVNMAATLAKLVEKKAVLRSTDGFHLSALSRTEMEKLLPARPTAVKTNTILTDLLAKVTNLPLLTNRMDSYVKTGPVPVVWPIRLRAATEEPAGSRRRT